MDPLSLLRQYTRGRHLKIIANKDDRITFGEQYSYPKNTLTAFKSSRGENYTLETVLHFINIHAGNRASAAEYVQSCTKQGIPPVVIQDRKVGATLYLPHKQSRCFARCSGVQQACADG